MMSQFIFTCLQIVNKFFTNNSPLFLLSHFQILICNERLVSFSFFFQPLKKVCFQTEILGNFFKYVFGCFILLFPSSSPCRKDQFAVPYFSTSLIVLIHVYNWEIRHRSLVCCYGLAYIFYIFWNLLLIPSKFTTDLIFKVYRHFKTVVNKQLLLRVIEVTTFIIPLISQI